MEILVSTGRNIVLLLLAIAVPAFSTQASVWAGFENYAPVGFALSVIVVWIALGRIYLESNESADLRWADQNKPSQHSIDRYWKPLSRVTCGAYVVASVVLVLAINGMLLRNLPGTINLERLAAWPMETVCISAMVMSIVITHAQRRIDLLVDREKAMKVWNWNL